jgi:hypothetical protein
LGLEIVLGSLLLAILVVIVVSARGDKLFWLFIVPWVGMALSFVGAIMR